MSRRAPNPAADRAAQNQLTLKTLVKIESNKSCADCKRNKHPRWASWNLGIFICIRCSGIHRGMGTHISRVKSVDLDAWTDEQLQSMIRWGNARANKYWEAKLAPGHVPAEAKIENFIRTKYDTKRWVMDGGIPDPSTLDTNGDEQTPVEAAQAHSQVVRSDTLRTPPSGPQSASAKPSQRHVDLFEEGLSTDQPDQTPSTVASVKPTPPPKTDMPAQRVAKPADSLLGLDFFSSAQAVPPPRPSSSASSNVNTSLPSRPDLKQSILSLYASSSRTASPMPPQSSGPGLSSAQSGNSNFSLPQHTISGGLDDAFGSLSFATTTPLAAPKVTAKSNAGIAPTQRLLPNQASASHLNQSTAKGGFFESTPSNIVVPSQAAATRHQDSNPSSSGFGDFISVSPPGWGSPQATFRAESILLHDGARTSLQSSSSIPPMANVSSVGSPSPFNLSSTSNHVQSNSDTRQIPGNNAASKSVGLDAWGSSEVWASSSSTMAAPKPPPKTSSTTAVNQEAWGWAERSVTSDNGRGSLTTAPVHPTQITRDEDFGGWESSAPRASATPQARAPNTAGVKPGGGFSGGGGEDLFSNVWE